MVTEEVQLHEEQELLKATLLAKSELSLIIKDYNDIFSSFDPRPYSERSLSDDFLIEAKRATRDKKGVYEIRFLIPKAQRNFEHETLIKKRLHEHFRRHYHVLQQNIKVTKRKGIFMALIGVVCIFGAASLAGLRIDSFFLRFFEVLLEPAGWFLAWTGLDQFFYALKEYKPDLDFYQKMADAEVRFMSY